MEGFVMLQKDFSNIKVIGTQFDSEKKIFI